MSTQDPLPGVQLSDGEEVGHPLGRGYRLVQGQAKEFMLYKDRVRLRTVDFKDGFARRVFLVQLVAEYGFSKMEVHRATGVSRQTIDNCLATVERWGMEGLVHASSKARRADAEAGEGGPSRVVEGNKARILEAEREKEREEAFKRQQRLAFGAGSEEERFAEEHSWKSSRYAGGLIYLPILERGWGLSGLLRERLGQGAQAIWLFIAMLVHGIGSVEALKTVVPSEFGVVLGRMRLPSKPVIWSLLTATYSLGRGVSLLKDVFRQQIVRGMVGCFLWYTDGHFLPYTGEEAVRYAYSTKRRDTFAGRTVYVTRDDEGRVVYFDLQEGAGDLRGTLSNVVGQLREIVPESSPIMIADRELWSVDGFLKLEQSEPRIYFLTWERHTDHKELESIPAEEFGEEWEHNGKEYRVLEQTKEYRNDKGQSIELRRIVLWNVTADQRTACVTNYRSGEPQVLAQAMARRWGVSENGFKRGEERWNIDYTPGYRIEEPSENQSVPNPRLKELDKEIKKKSRQRNNLAVKLASLNRATEISSEEASGRRQELEPRFDRLEVEIGQLRAEKKACPERIEFSQLKGKELKRIDDESKVLFDVAQMLATNAEKELARELAPHYTDPRDRLVVLQMITHCHGWVKVTEDEVRVRLERLETPRYRAAQQGLLARLNAMNTWVAPGKRILFEVGPSPLSA